VSDVNASSAERGLGDYYDRLTAWTRVAAWFGYSGGRDALTSHRALADPHRGLAPSPTRLHDLLVESLPAMTAPRILDAGCGLGGTLIDLASRLGGSGVGLTLSRQQARVANRAVARAGLLGRVRIDVGTYDQPPPGPFDLVVAIESIAHSADPAVTLSALVAVLAPDGHLAIVDDLPLPGAAGGADLAAFQAGWKCPVLWDGGRYRETLGALGLLLERERDLTSGYTPRSPQRIRRLEALNRAVRGVVPSASWRALIDAYLGGLALERLYLNGAMRYTMLIARRP
jgi:cyclopropane fatty-acyl-phospholipid synthase-like methyltransferase